MPQLPMTMTEYPPIVDSLYCGELCLECKLLVKGKTYELLKQLKWNQSLCKCEPKPEHKVESYEQMKLF